MAAFSDEEKRILANVLPGVAAVLRSPLNNLHMAAQRLAQRQGDSDEAAVMRQSYYRMLRLVGNLAMGPELASDKPFETRNEELAALLDELCRQADSIAREAGVEVRFDCRERYVVAAVDRTYWERLVWNLLSNALKATPRGGTVTVTLEVRGGQVLLRVKDTGRGIPADRFADLAQLQHHVTAYRSRHYIHYSVYPSVVLLSYMFISGAEVDDIVNIIEGIRYGLSPAQIRRLLTVSMR